MQITTNRYYKDSQLGYRFQLEAGFFSDHVLTNGIGRGLIGRVIGNRSVNCWLGGVVQDTHEQQYYVFGHNKMEAQETGSNRLSCLFTFALIPFESLHQVGGVSALMAELSKMEQSTSSQPAVFNLREGYTNGRMVDEQIADALAAYAADQSISLDLFDSTSGCIKALDTIWKSTLFARKMPVVVLIDKHSQEQPQYGWKMVPTAGERTFKGGSIEGKYLPPESSYLFFAYGYAMKYEQDRCRNALNPGEISRLHREFGSVNDRVFEQLLLWYYAITRRMEMLPTEEEKSALIQAIR